MDTLTLALVGAAYGTTLAAGVSGRAWRVRSKADGLLALLLSCGVVAILAIAVEHRLAGGPPAGLLERIEHVATLASGPVLWLYVQAALGRGRFGPARMVHFAPAAAAAVVPATLVPPIELLVAHQMSYTVLAAVLRFRGQRAVRCHGAATLAVLGVVLAVHAAQAVRIASRGAPLLVDVVPATLSLALLACGAAAGVVWIAHQGAARSRSGVRRMGRWRSGARRTGGRRAAGAAEADAELLRRLDRLMEEEHLYRKADLGLHELAAALEVTPHRLSGALNATRGVALTHYLGRFRVEDARRRLRDPGHAIYTIEAIGERSGFGSRSAFYSVFRRETGTTPARFRAGSHPGDPSGSS